MTFFVITVSIMAVSILLIYKLCRFFGLELKWISLVLCAILAFVVNGATIMLSPFLTQDHYVRLAALVLVSAALVTLINEYLLKRDHRTELASAGGPAISIEEPEDTPEEEAQELLAASTNEAEELSRRLMEAMKANNPTEQARPAEEPQPEAENSAESQSAAAETKVESAAAVVEDAALETAEQPSAEENTATTETTETSQAAPGEESTETAGTPAAKEEAAAPAEETPSPVEEATAPSEAVPEEAAAPDLPKEDAAEKPAAEDSATAEPQQEQPAEETPVAEPPQEQEEPLPEEAASPAAPVQELPEPEAAAPEPPTEETPAQAEPSQEDSPTEEPETMDLSLEDTDETVASLGSLDELLDYAYSHKESDPNAAISAYRAAIDRYPDDSYAPFLIIELAGLYKERASYHEAINLYAESLGLPIIAGDDAMMQEFSKTLRYLGTVQDILNKHQALATPFSKLTPEILGEIETEFAKRQAK